ncbi:MAG: thiamine diphosphokinase [Caldilineaceae bacterium]
MRAALFINGAITDYESIRPWLANVDYLIAADGGAHHCLQMNRLPDAVVGDLDSLEEAVVTHLHAEGVHIERHPTEKGQTDLELALEFALRAGAEEILLLGAVGGRLDQTLANLLILAQRDWPARLLVIEGNQVAQLAPIGKKLTLQAAIGDTVSALPLSDSVTGITYTGMRYPLENATLRLGSTRGISNEVAVAPATVQITSGHLLIIQTMTTAAQ